MNRKELFSSGNYVAKILDEVSLEGLDGITFDTLILRLSLSKDFGLTFETESAKEFLFQVLRKKIDISSKDVYDENSETLRAYLLPADRLPVVIYDRNQYSDHEYGNCVEPDDLGDDPYPFKLIDANEVKGSCSTYDSRINVSKRFLDGDVDNLSKFGAAFKKERLVFVASQYLRAFSILGHNYDPMLVMDLSPMQWVILERVGRARYHGETTHGKLSLNFTKESPKSLFYHRKVLVRRNLITKQVHYLKIKSQNFQGLLLHLPRFYVEMKSKALSFTYAIVKFLKTRPPSFAASYEDVNEFLGRGYYKKLYQNTDFKRFIVSDIKIPFRLLHPEAPEREMKCKGNKEKERTVRCIQLKDPDIDPEEVLQPLSKDEDLEDDEDDAQEVLDRSNWRVDRTLFWQAYNVLDKAGPDGLSQIELGKRLGVDKLDARCLMRNLLRRGVASSFMKDVGRQRVTVYVARRFFTNSSNTNQIEIEKKKLLDLTRTEGDESMNVSVVNEDSKGTAATPMQASSPVKMDVKTEGSDRASVSFGSPQKKTSENPQTIRRLRRSNTILEAVRQYKVIDDPVKLYKLIAENERAEGFDGKMDRKSMKRILAHLAEQGHIKNIRIRLEVGGKSKDLVFVCEPDIDESHTIIQSAVEQAKMKLNIVPKERCPLVSVDESESDAGDDPSIGESLKEMKSMQTGTSGEKVILLRNNGRKYGVKPKFLRMQEFHRLLFYLCRCYEGQQIQDVDLFIATHKSDRVLIDDVVETELRQRQFFLNEISWKMFIPPLPVHKGWGKGWCLMCDILLRLPLSIFVAIVNVTAKIDGLQNYLDHPIRKHYLVKSLPSEIRTKLLFHRKYIFSAYELATRLGFIGVVQFGPQKLKEKDQIFLYVNVNASLYDTTSSARGYHQVEDKEYPLKKYFFEKLVDVEKYWLDMHEISFYTSLGGSSTVTGKEITLEAMEKKPSLLAAIEPRQSGEVAARDNGEIPGDHLGSAGLDSSMFSHLKRNWVIQSSQNAGVSKKRKSQDDDYLIPKKKIKPGSLIQIPIEDKETNPKAVKSDLKSLPFIPASKEKKPRSIKRFIKKRKTHPRVPYYDEIDKAALKLMTKLRVDWNPEEDSFLLLCKVAGSYLCQNISKQIIHCASIRDLLHKHYPKCSLNKTSRACQRRLAYMLKNPTTASNVTLFYADLQQDPEVRNRFKPIKRSSLSKSENLELLNRQFASLVDLLLQKYKSPSGFSGQEEIPDTIEAIKKKYRIIEPDIRLGKGPGFVDPSTENEIKSSVIHSLIVSSLNSHLDKTNWAFHMFKIYQQYPDSLLREVMDKLRNDRLVSLNKHFNRTRAKNFTYLPLSASPYQLSVHYMHKLLSRYQFDIYPQSWHLMRNLIESYLQGLSAKGVEIVTNQEGGFVATVVALFATQKVAFRTEIPEQVIVLDPSVSVVDEQYVRILERYKELLKATDDLDLEEQDEKGKSLKKEQLKMCDFLRKERSITSGSPTSRGQKRPTAAAKEAATKNVSDESTAGPFEEGLVFHEPQNQTDESRSGVSVAKSASRLALYMMREEIRDEDETITVQHSHDYFVISSCNVKCKLLQNDQNLSGELLTLGCDGFCAPKDLLPVNADRLSKLMMSYGLDLNGLPKPGFEKCRKTCLPKSVMTLEAFIDSGGLSSEDALAATDIYAAIENSKVNGITGDELRSTLRQHNDDILTRLVREMMDKFLIIKTGVVTVRFVAVGHAHSWILHSFRMPQTKVRDKLGPKRSRLDSHSEEGASETKSTDIESQISSSSDSFDWESVELVDVLIRPWLRIDGTLNRRVIDRLLSSLLGFIMQKPGMTVEKLAEKLSPALMPVHTRELVEMLAEIGCLELKKLVRRGKASLFSNSLQPELVNYSIFDSNSSLVIEPRVDAVVKMGQFIGDRKYSTNIYDCPCHPTT